MTSTLFISDLHLHHSRPAATDRFLRFLEVEAKSVAALFILGDLFESWIGDDDPDPHHRQVADALRAYTASGCRCAVMRGNRDFLIGRRFGEETGIQLLDDIVVERLHEQPVMMMHGDQLCTDDQRYQAFRRRVRNRTLQRLFLSMPLALRRSVELRMRSRSQSVTAAAPEYIMDVNAEAVADVMRRQNVRTLIHGHTHRPGIHQFELNGAPATRIVLGDWYAQGSVLAWSPSGYELLTLPFH